MRLTGKEKLARSKLRRSNRRRSCADAKALMAIKAHGDRILAQVQAYLNDEPAPESFFQSETVN
jgi:ribosomal protein L21E